MPTSASRNGGRDARRAGLTLIEILVVLAIAAVLFGAGIGVFKGITRSGARQAARAEVLNLIHKARNAARGEERSAILFEENGTRVRAIIQRVVALLHFEDLEDGVTTGADRKDGKVAGGTIYERGKVRRAMQLEGGTIDLGRYPDYDATDGVGAELWFKPASKNTMTLLEKGRSWRLYVEPARTGLVVKAEIHVGRSNAGSTRLLLDGSGTVLPVGRWAHIGFSYDRAFAILEVNRVEIARVPKDPSMDSDSPSGAMEPIEVEPETRPIVRDPEAPLMIGSGGSPVDGYVDEVRVTAVLSGDVVNLPEGVTIECESDGIHFEDGWLDDRFHTAPVKFSVQFEGRGKPVVVGLNGMPMK